MLAEDFGKLSLTLRHNSMKITLRIAVPNNDYENNIIVTESNSKSKGEQNIHKNAAATLNLHMIVFKA